MDTPNNFEASDDAKIRSAKALTISVTVVLLAGCAVVYAIPRQLAWHLTPVIAVFIFPATLVLWPRVTAWLEHRGKSSSAMRDREPNRVEPS
jgi:hypothetical protein